MTNNNKLSLSFNKARNFFDWQFTNIHDASCVYVWGHDLNSKKRVCLKQHVSDVNYNGNQYIYYIDPRFGIDYSAFSVTFSY